MGRMRSSFWEWGGCDRCFRNGEMRSSLGMRWCDRCLGMRWCDRGFGNEEGSIEVLGMRKVRSMFGNEEVRSRFWEWGGACCVADPFGIEFWEWGGAIAV